MDPFTCQEIEARMGLPDVNGYDIHRIVTLDRLYTYEQPVIYEVKRTAFGGWWGVATFADGTVLSKFRGKPARIISKAEMINRLSPNAEAIHGEKGYTP
jgi:hypothetical protein